MKAVLRLFVVELLFLLLGVVVIAALLTLREGTQVWRDLGVPPGAAIHIVDGDYQSVQVQTTSDGVYYCRFTASAQCWVRNDHPTYRRSLDDDPFVGRQYRGVPALAGVVATKRFYSQVSEYEQVLSIYAVTENGHVYLWQDGFGTPFDVIGYVFYGIPLALIGGFGCWVVLEAARILLRKRDPRAPQRR